MDELKQKLHEQILPPVPVPSSKEDIDELENEVHSVINNQRWAQVTLYQKRNTTKRNDLFNQ